MKHIKTSCKLAALALAMIMLTSCGQRGTVKGAAGETPAGAGELWGRDSSAVPDPRAPVPEGALSAAALEKHQKQVFAMDTVMLLTAYGENGQAALDAAEERIIALEDDLDPESETGSVYALNSGAGGQVVLSEDCYNVMSTTMEIYHASGGALDPGLYPISKAWGFIGGHYRVPSAGEIGGLLAAKNTGGIRLDGDNHAAAVPAGMEVSFGAVAKGYTAQAVVELMGAMGVESAIVSLGGNVQTLGDLKPDGSQWQVAVVDPHDTGAYAGILTVGQAAVVTSGGYQRYFEQDGVTYIHIIDPADGYPVGNDLLSVTVVTEDGARADALSTTLFVLGKDAALEFYAKQGDFELILITKDDRVIVTTGLAGGFSETAGDVYTYEYIG